MHSDSKTPSVIRLKSSCYICQWSIKWCSGFIASLLFRRVPLLLWPNLVMNPGKSLKQKLLRQRSKMIKFYIWTLIPMMRL